MAESEAVGTPASKPEPTYGKTYDRDNGRGKSNNNAGPSPANLRGMEPSIDIKRNDSLGMAKPVASATEVR